MNHAPFAIDRIGQCRSLIVVLLLLFGGTRGTLAVDPPRRVTGSTATPAAAIEALPRKAAPLEEDAQLHDVQFVSDQRGWAVGDHGVIWHTSDGGEQWNLQNSGVSCSLYSVCFLSDRVGWAAGGGTMPFTRLSYGVLLHTTDGGKTWQTLLSNETKCRAEPARKDAVPDDNPPAKNSPASNSSGPGPAAKLPRLTRVKFFSQDQGFAAGQGSEDQPSGVFFTEDGGASWRDLPGQTSPGWLAADFLNEEIGVVAGPRGRVALIAGEQIALPRVENLGVRGLHGVALQRPRSGWLVGDGGLVLRTDNAGLVWEAPPTPLPEGIREAFDFRTVCCRGKHVWVAGEPGSVIWHSADGGKSWEKQTTEQTLPLAAIRFSSDECGCAVGALGTILQTSDGGATWETVRGGGRRLALMLLQGTQPQVSLKPVVEHSGELGYRSLISVVASSDVSTAGSFETAFPVRLADAVSLAGGSAARVDWRLPLAIPGLERNAEKLVADWKRRTEGRLEEILIGGIVRQLRTWRPSVLVLEKPAETDALTRLINQAAIKAAEQARDSTRFLEQQELAGLQPWHVQKVYLHLPPGSTGHVQVDPHQYLARMQQTVHSAASPAESLLFDETAAPPLRETYRLVRTHWDDEQGASIAANFFAGLSIPPGSDARRQLLPIDDRDLTARQKLAQKQRNFAAVTDRTLDDPRKAGQLIAQLSDAVHGMSDDQGALQLAELAERYHEHGQWELAELAMVELVEKYPEQPAALRAMQQLVQYWASAEITWRRLKKSSNSHQRERTDPSQISQAIVQVEARLAKQARDDAKTVFDVDDGSKETDAVDVSRPERNVATAGYVVHKQFDQKLRFWQAQAARMARNLEQRAPQLAATPEVQFPMAALFRQREKFARADEIYRRFLQRETRGAWAWPAAAELWLNQPIAPLDGPVVDCIRVPQRPVLDGVLSDNCWQDAAEMPLNDANKGGGRSLAMLCHDGEYLYLAVSLPRAAGVRTDGPTQAARRYDEDLADFDRVTLCLDVDRDRVTYFGFSIDQRGCTSESCWHDRSWNPAGWIVAVDADDTHWRLEAAIPFAELTPRPPEAGSAWGVAVVRTIPAVGWQSWTQPVGEKLRPETFGLVRFD